MCPLTQPTSPDPPTESATFAPKRIPLPDNHPRPAARPPLPQRTLAAVPPRVQPCTCGPVLDSCFLPHAAWSEKRETQKPDTPRYFCPGLFGNFQGYSRSFQLWAPRILLHFIFCDLNLNSNLSVGREKINKLIWYLAAF